MVRSKSSFLLLVIPFSLFFIGFTLPLIWAIGLSLFSDTGVFIGLANYLKTFKDASFWSSITFTFIYAGSVTISLVVLGYFIALAVNQLGSGGTIAKTVMLIPWAISLTAWGLMMQVVTSQDFGVLNDLLLKFHLIKARISWLGVAANARPMVIVSRIMKDLWFSTLLFLVARQTLPIELYEEGKVSGANPFQSFWHITTPLLRTTMLSVLTILLIFAFQEFDMIFALTRGGPGFATETASLSIYRWGILFGRFSLGTAYTTVWSLFVSIFVVVILGRVLIRGIAKKG